LTLARPTASGLALTVHLTPGAGRDEVVGEAVDAEGGTVLKARVRAVPEKGKANAALVKLLAKHLKLGKTRLDVTKGKTSRVKTVEIACDPDEIEPFIRKLAETD
jgi:uncharacterized protein (TIGR00251 family)